MTGAAGGPSSATVGRWSIGTQVGCAAPPSEVWPLVGEARRWKDWSFLTRSALIRPGAPDPDGVGAVRRFTRWGVGSKEEVTAWDPPHHLGYAILSGFPVRRYRADVILTPEAGGTSITWSATFDPLVPGTGRILSAVLQHIVGGFGRDLAGYADRGHGTGPTEPTGPTG